MKAKVERKVSVEIRLDGNEVAEAFWNLSSDEQAKFFNRLGDLGGGDSFLFPSQLCAVNTDPELKDSGRRAMQRIGEYSH